MSGTNEHVDQELMRVRTHTLRSSSDCSKRPQSTGSLETCHLVQLTCWARKSSINKVGRRTLLWRRYSALILLCSGGLIRERTNRSHEGPPELEGTGRGAWQEPGKEPREGRLADRQLPRWLHFHLVIVIIAILVIPETESLNNVSASAGLLTSTRPYFNTAQSIELEDRCLHSWWGERRVAEIQWPQPGERHLLALSSCPPTASRQKPFLVTHTPLCAGAAVARLFEALRYKTSMHSGLIVTLNLCCCFLVFFPSHKNMWKYNSRFRHPPS